LSISAILHTSLVAAFLLIFFAKDHMIEDVPIEITEFVRNLGAPSASKTPQALKKSQIAPSKASAKSEGGNSAATSPSSAASGSGESISEDYEVSQMPVLMNEVRVAYPAEAKAKNIQGNVVFDLLIGSDGLVRELKVVSSPDSTLTQAAQGAVNGFKFRPAKMGDKSVAIRIRYTYRFLLQ
jgi:protein TonB